MGEIIEISIIMWIVAIVAFAPLGYFIYLFTVGNGESFGKSDPSNHSVEHKKYYKLIDNTLSSILGGGSSPAVQTQATPSRTTSRRTSSASTSGNTTTTRRRRPSTRRAAAKTSK